MSRTVTIITLLLVVIVGLALYARNNDPVFVDYYLGRIEIPLFLVAVAALVVGAALGLLACVPLFVKLRYQITRLKKTIRLKEKDLITFRISPSPDQAPDQPPEQAADQDRSPPPDQPPQPNKE